MKAWPRGAERRVTGRVAAVVVHGLLLGLVLALLTACGGSADAGGTTAAATVADETGPAPPGAPDATPRRVVLVMGDSLSAAYNLAAEQGWVALLEARLAREGRPWRMVNASISGETSAGGASRIGAALAEHRPGLVLIELGANDGLRGLPLEATRANLETMVRAAKAAGAGVLVIGMRLPPNYGPEYTEAFFALFGEVARAEGVAYLPFLLEPIAFEESAFQPDRLHPTAEAQPRIAEHVWAALEPLLDPAPTAGAP